MSERYEICKRCNGRGAVLMKDKSLPAILDKMISCMACDGTGSSGDVMGYLEKEQKKDSAEEQRLMREYDAFNR